MCISVELFLPIIEKFMLFYPLRCGSILIYMWTLFRSMFSIFYVTTAILEVMIGEKLPFVGALLVQRKPETEYVFLVFYTQVALLLCEGVLMVFTIYLVTGILDRNCNLLSHYLVCRFFAWFIEVICLLALCFLHKLLIGWYLAILFFVVLEFYSFIVIYSYYVKLREIQKSFKECPSTKV